MVDFRFYLNKQGIRGQKGEKGDTGFSPSIVEEVNTLTDYRLKIINEFDEFVTDNLRGSDYFDITDPNGTYLRFNKETGRAYTGALDQATNEVIGGARLANASDMETFSENTIVTPSLLVDSLVNLIISPDGSLNITQNEETSKTEITFNSATLDAVRAEINRVKEDLTTESQVRLNADNQQQVAIDAERRERETQDAALQNQISSLGNNFVTLDTAQQITGYKTFSINGFSIKDHGSIGGGFGSGITISGNDVRLRVGAGSITQMNFDGTSSKLLNQNTIEQGENIIVEKTTNGIKISSTASGGAIIDDGDPAADKVYSSSKTSDLVGELGNEVNSIAGRLNTLEGEVKVATTENLGLVQPDGTTITIDSDGKISAVGGGSGVEIDDNTIKKNSNNQIYVDTPSLTYDRWDNALRIQSGKLDVLMNSDTIEYKYGLNVKLPLMWAEGSYTTGGAPNLKLPDSMYSQTGTHGQLVFRDPDTLEIDPLVSFRTIKAGSNMNITKNVNDGTITFDCTGGVDPEIETRVENLEAKVDELELFKFPNATIEGDPTINNGQISNFSTTNYLRFPFEFKTEGRTWLLNGSFDTDTDVTTQQNIIDSLASIALAVRNGRLVLALSTNGTSFNLGEHLSMSDIEPNTKYYYRLSFSGTQYLLSISTDKQEWLPEIIVASEEPIASKPMTISSSGHPFKGTLNLNDWDLTVANTLVWQGMDDVGISSRMDVNASNVTETGKQAIKDIVGLDNIEEALRLLNGGDSTLLDTKLDKSTPHIIDTFVDGTSGYRTWSDGYCEQWGNAHVSSVTNNFTVSFLKKFKDNNYIVTGTTVPPVDYSGFSGTTNYRDVICIAFTIGNKTIDSFKIQSIYSPDTTNGISGDKQWKACGYLAEGEY